LKKKKNRLLTIIFPYTLAHANIVPFPEMVSCGVVLCTGLVVGPKFFGCLIQRPVVFIITLTCEYSKKLKYVVCESILVNSIVQNEKLVHWYFFFFFETYKKMDESLESYDALCFCSVNFRTASEGIFFFFSREFSELLLRSFFKKI